MKGKNHVQTKRSNLSVVFEIIRQNPRISRVSVAQMSGLRNQTITNLVRELIQTGYVLEVGKVQGKRGQPQTLLEVNPASCVSIGLQIDQGFISGSLVDLNLETLAEHQVVLDSLEPAYVVCQLSALVEMLIQCVPDSRKSMVGVGVAVATLVKDDTERHLVGAEWESWNKFNLTEQLSQKLGYPVYLENDATSAAIGHSFGGGRDRLENFIYLYIGNGLGAGIITNNQPYKGAWSNAGEVGRIHWHCSGDVEYIETHLSVQALKTMVNYSGSDLELPAFIDQNCLRSKACENWVVESAKRLRYVINILENLFEPESIVIGSRLSGEVMDRLVDATLPLFPSICERHERTRKRITLSHHSVSVGAASLPLFGLCHPDRHDLFECSHQLPPTFKVVDLEE
ncbi:putative Transcriptional regulator/sugar kinase [Vibrio nigripulchritudo MADA3029]|uniref:ROK family transcriptional regulator n=1 Tax=Vibrio nigripulchritudo TaxID=28173 RepID=UPI0003B1A61A|nr:ROK family transcriptional regulator [Vibrio nigripulchritudo]CCN46682.1 putative Transcriptional regulator/sugar kinase [Vibrio nigripulchritudo MADA3020]CCN54541.1 putative Transcriptional regulator/sugar kinase [Vibrio nigripulchritudo MADA3021]CCN59541.1 putative Transcriptional regulator/sugar kinase [Vibrio nigripulchritudo MADA3029]